MSTRTIKAAVVKDVVEAIQRPDNTTILILNVDDGQEIGLIFEAESAEAAISQLLSRLPPSAGAELGISVADDLKSPLLVEEVAVSRPDESAQAPFDMEFQAAGRSWVKLSIPHQEAVRWMHRLRAHVTNHARRHGH